MGFRAKELIHGADYNPDQWLDTPGIIDEDVRLMELAGLNSVTVGVFSWKNLEPEEGVYTFEWLDEIMDRMDADTTVSAELKQKMIRNVMNGRWFSAALDARYGNPTLWK